MVNEPHKLILLPNRSYQAVARSEIKKIALTAGFSTKRMAELEIVIAEITSNIVKHTNGGELLIKIIKEQNPGIEIICIDSGPGMESVSRMMEDGISSTNTLGQGLGAIKRFSNECDIYSQHGWGTVLLSRFFEKKPDNTKKNTIDTGIIMVAKEGETACGDGYHYSIKGNNIKFAVCDGLGHGKDAHAAAAECLKTYCTHIILPPADQVKIVHSSAKRTRGAVMYIMNIDFNNKQALYCGVGNITAKMLSALKPKYCISYNGIVGHSIPGTLNNHVLQITKNDLVVVHTDGLSSRWDLQKYPGIQKHNSVIIAAALYKDFCRKSDDITVAVIRQLPVKA